MILQSSGPPLREFTTNTTNGGGGSVTVTTQSGKKLYVITSVELKETYNLDPKITITGGLTCP
jgi:hypothetical protein